jgi:hypothetical protein
MPGRSSRLCRIALRYAGVWLPPMSSARPLVQRVDRLKPRRPRVVGREQSQAAMPDQAMLRLLSAYHLASAIFRTYDPTLQQCSNIYSKGRRKSVCDGQREASAAGRYAIFVATHLAGRLWVPVTSAARVPVYACAGRPLTAVPASQRGNTSLNIPDFRHVCTGQPNKAMTYRAFRRKRLSTGLTVSDWVLTFSCASPEPG